MAAKKGNQWWKLRARHGRKRKFTPEALAAACDEYLEMCEKNPLKEEKVFCQQGVVTRTTVDHMRAPTISGLCLFLDVSQQTWSTWRDMEDFAEITKKAEAKIWNKKFAGAAAGLLNPLVICRELGLREHVEQRHSGDLRVEVIDNFGPVKKPAGR